MFLTASIALVRQISEVIPHRTERSRVQNVNAFALP